MPVLRIADIAEFITARRRTYDEALAADMRRLAKAHGETVVQEALKLVGRRKPANHFHWNADAHRRAVAAGLQRVLIERHLARQSGLSESDLTE
jgi:hypothetical protein